MSSKKIKHPKKIEKPCTECFKPQYFKFNFTYMDSIEKVNNDYKLQLLNRMLELSTEPYTVIAIYRKNIGFETEDIDVLGLSKIVPAKFSERFSKTEYNNKITIIRLYTNDNPILARIIGVLINKVFYMFSIDIGGKLYPH